MLLQVVSVGTKPEALPFEAELDEDALATAVATAVCKS